MRSTPFAFALTLLAGLLAGHGLTAQELNVYSARKDHLIKPLLDEYSKQSGVKINLLSAGEDQLLERLKSEGPNSPADVLITTDVAHLHKARVAGVLQPVSSPVIDRNIPARFRDAQGYWFGLSSRARVIFIAKDRVEAKAIQRYEDLADPKWKGRICIRSSSSTYNQSLLAAIIAVSGPDKAEQWAKGMVDNFARKPQGGDRDQILAVASGQCDVAVANTYYYGNLQTSDKVEERDAAAKVTLVFPNQGQGDRGAHMNVAGAGVTQSAKNKAAAIALIEYLSGPQAQQVFAQANSEFPLRDGTPVSPVVASWGPFRGDAINVDMLGENNPRAIRIFDRVGWR